MFSDMRVSPLNVEEAMRRFFASNCTECPILEYSASIRPAIGNIDDALLREAETILRLALDRGLPSLPVGPMIESSDLKNRMHSYLDSLGLTDRVDIVEGPEAMLSIAKVVKPGSSKPLNSKHTVYLTRRSVPESIVPSLCAHELGTHLLRMMNNDHQLWSGSRRINYKLSNHLCTEEGLATLNGLLADTGFPLLFSAALRYLAAVLGRDANFVELFNRLAAYVPDPQVRFRYCCRVKRGVSDTSLPGSNSDDQSYFIGAVDLLRHLECTDFVSLYSGLVDRKDMERLKNLIRIDCIHLPPFLRSLEAVEGYMQRLRYVAQCNRIQVTVRVGRQMSRCRSLRLMRRLSRSKSRVVHVLC